MFRSNVFPVKSGFSRAGKKKGRGKKKKWWTDRWRDDASTILNRDTLLCLYAFTRRVPLQGIQKNLAISRQFATTRDNVQFFISPSPLEKTTKRHANISRKNAATLPTKDLSSSARKKKMSIRAAAEMQMFEGNLYSHSPLR